MTELFDDIGKYYDLLYQNKDYESEAEYLDLLLKRFSNQTQSILELGCGTGKHAKYLFKKGYKIHGIDRSKSMIEIASKNKRGIYEQGDILKINLEKEFDVIISLFHVFSYQTSNSSVLKLLSNAYKHLKKGGIFIFDIWYSPAVLSIGPSNRFLKLSNDDIEILRIAEPEIFPNENIVKVKYQFFVREKLKDDWKTFKEIHPMRHFSLPELSFYAESKGFSIIHSEEWLTGLRPSKNSWSICLVLKK